MPTKEYSNATSRRGCTKSRSRTSEGTERLWTWTSLRSPILISSPSAALCGLEKKPTPASTPANVELSADDPAFLKWIEALDERNVNVAAEQSEEWFKKKLSAGYDFYRACAQPGKEPGKFAPLVRVKVAESGDKPAVFTVYKDANGDEIPQGND